MLKYKVPFIMEKHIEEFLAIEGVSGFYCGSTERHKGYTGLLLHPGHETWCLGIIDGTVPLGGDVTEEFREYLIEEHLKAAEVGASTNSFIEVYDSRWHPAFVNGAVELVEGRHVGIHDEAKIVISDELVEKNGLKIGDKITVRQWDIWTGEFYGDPYETEIVGIFHINFEQEVIQERTYENDILANTFFSTPDVDYWSRHAYQVQYGKDVTAQESEERLREIVLFVEDPALLDSVKEKLLAIDSVDWSYYHFGTYDKDYQTAASPLLSMMKISDMLVIISALGILVILSLVFRIWMRSRNHEIGILFSIGVQKNAVLLQLILECGMIAAAAFLAAFLFAGPAADLVGDGLQTLFYAGNKTEGYEVITSLRNTQMQINMLPSSKAEGLSYAVTLKEMCFVFFILAGTAAVSVLASCVKMFRRNPREVLEKR